MASAVVSSPEWIKALRAESGLTQSQLAERWRAVGDVQLSEWAKAANLRDQYWVYVVFDCAASHPRLLRVQDPFAKLLVRARGGVIIDEGSIFQAAETEAS
jgi:hypothetical protein